MLIEYKLENIESAAKELIAVLNNRKVIAFHGQMGAGKTTFIQAVCKLLQVKNAISSPTFSIINEYISKDGDKIFHLDFYRLKNEEEAVNAGVEDVLASGSLCLVEWPEKAPGLFPADTVICSLSAIANNARKLQINL